MLEWRPVTCCIIHESYDCIFGPNGSCDGKSESESCHNIWAYYMDFVRVNVME